MAAGVVERVRGWVRQAWRTDLVRSTIIVIAGVSAVIAPTTAALVGALAFGVYALGDGLINVSESLLARPAPGRVSRAVFGGLVAVLGVVVLIWPRPTVTVVVILVALGLLAYGLLQVLAGLAIRGITGSGWGWAIAVGALAIAFASLILVRPMTGQTSIVRMLGAGAIMWGLASYLLPARSRHTDRERQPA